MSEKKSWLETGLPQELARVDLAKADEYEVEEEANALEPVLGVVNDTEKRYFILYVMYRFAATRAESHGQEDFSKLCQLRAARICEEFYFRISERFEIWKTDIEELGVRRGWKLISLNSGQRVKISAMDAFLSGNCKTKGGDM